MAKRIIKVLCLQDTADHRQLYEKGKVYNLPVDHPCMEYFEQVKEVSDPAELGPPGVVLKRKKDGRKG